MIRTNQSLTPFFRPAFLFGAVYGATTGLFETLQTQKDQENVCFKTSITLFEWRGSGACSKLFR